MKRADDTYDLRDENALAVVVVKVEEQQTSGNCRKLRGFPH